MEDGMRKSNIHLSRVPKEVERKNGTGAIFYKLKAEKISELMSHLFTDSRSLSSHKQLSRSKSIPQHITTKGSSKECTSDRTEVF